MARTKHVQSRALGKVHELMGAVSERSGDALGGFVITETSPEGGAYFDPNTRVVTIGVDTLTDGNASEAVSRSLEKDGTLGTIVHEVGHGIEETNAGKALAKLVTDDKTLHDLAITDVLERSYMKEHFGENADVDAVSNGIKALIAKENNGEVLTESEREALDEYKSEVAAFANQRLLGNKAFMKKLITTEPSTAEKLIAKIRELREDLKVRKDPEAKAQLELVRKAEKLFMQGLSEAGGTIDAAGKIHLANREEDETVSKSGETVIETTENVSESSKSVRRLANPKNVDKGDGKRYNMNRTTVDEKAGTDYLIHNFNGEVRYDPEILPLSDRELAVISHAVKTGWGKLNVDKKYGYVFSSKNCYAFFYNSDNSITITSYFDADIHQELINIAKEVVENDTNGEGEIKTAGIWPAFLRDGGTGYRYNAWNGVQQPQTSGDSDPMAGNARGSHDGGNLGRSGGDRANGQVKFRRKGERATLTVNGETLNSIGKPDYFTDAAQSRRAVWCFGPDRYCVEGARLDTQPYYATADAAIKAENESLIREYAKRYGLSENTVKNRLRDDEWFLHDAMMDGGVRRSRTTTGETVTISKGELAKLHANYAGDKVFAKGAVTEALKGIDALKVLSAERRREIANEIWTGYNKRLHQQGFEMFTELAWHQIHAEILQESGFEMSEDEVAKMDEQIVNALHQIVASGKPSIKAKLESDTSTEGYRKQAQFWRDEHGKAVEYHKRLNTLKFELEKLANQKKGLYVNAANFRGDSFKVAIDELAKMNWRGGLVSAGKIREHFAKLAAWYTKENPLYKGDGGTGSLFRQEIADVLNSLGNSQNGALTVEDLQAAETVVKYFAHEIEAHNTVFKDGKRVDAMPEAKGYIEKVRQAKEIAAKCGITVRTALGQSNNFSKEMIKYFKELKQDVEGISKKRSQEKWYNDAVGFIRSSYATYQLGANKIRTEPLRGNVSPSKGATVGRPFSFARTLPRALAYTAHEVLFSGARDE